MDVNQTRKKNGSKATEPNIEQFDYHYTIQSLSKCNRELEDRLTSTKIKL